MDAWPAPGRVAHRDTVTTGMACAHTEPKSVKKQTFPNVDGGHDSRSGNTKPRGMNKGICSNFLLAHRSGSSTSGRRRTRSFRLRSHPVANTAASQIQPLCISQVAVQPLRRYSRYDDTAALHKFAGCIGEAAVLQTCAKRLYRRSGCTATVP